MLRLAPRPIVSNRILLVSTAVLLAYAGNAVAQSGARSAEVTPPPAATEAAPATVTEEQGRGWLFRSALLNVSKPEVTAPSVEWNAEAADAAVTEGHSRFMQPVYRVREAAKSAMERTRAAWNGAVEKVKFRSDGGAPPMFARWFGGEETPAVAQESAETFTR